MPEYVYRNQKGKEHSIVQSMRDEHPEAISLAPDGSWSTALPTDPSAFIRVYGNTQLNSDPVTRRYPIASVNLPLHLDGEKCTKAGNVIIRNRDHERRLCEQHGYVRVED